MLNTQIFSPPSTTRLAISFALLLLFSLGSACSDDNAVGAENNVENNATLPGGNGGKGDDFHQRDFEVLLTEPHCDECSGDDKTYLQGNSAIIARIVELLDEAEETVDVAQFTFSDRTIENAIYRAHARGVRVRVAMDHGQDRPGSLSRRLIDNGIDVRFVRGNEVGNQQRYGLMHSKFMVVDARTLLSGSNNWSSTGLSINEENTIIMTASAEDTLVEAFQCHFDAAWENAPGDSAGCSTTDARFSPGVAARNLIRDSLREARHSIDVLMHHLLFDDLVRELANAAERGVQVRVVMNIEDRHVYVGGHWDRLQAAGGMLRFKRNNTDEFQYMHHKLAIIDGNTLLHGSGNWSGSGFFNNFEFYVRYRQPQVVFPFLDLFNRLWHWSLNEETIELGQNAARQHHRGHEVYFGNLHAHIEQEGEDGKYWDDGELLRSDYTTGELYSVRDEMGERHVVRYAYEYARDVGNLDFMAISPHVVDVRPEDPLNHPSMSPEGYADLVRISREITEESQGGFVAIPSMEWNTNSEGNHVNIFGTDTLAQVERGRFDILYEEFLPGRVSIGERPFLQFNHPRTFRQNEESLSGNWDQIYGVNLLEISSDSQRRYKFNDFGLNDYPPLSEVIDSWIAGEAMPSREVVSQTLSNIEEVTRPYLRLMEVTIGRGTDISHENSVNPSWVERDGQPYHYTRVESDWHYYLLQGFRLAPTANHDNHYANWGSGHSSRTAIIAPELTERNLLEGINQRLVYATEDENMAVGFYADGRIPMGSEVATLANHVNFQLYFEDPDDDGPFEVHLFYGRIGGDDVEVRTHMTNVGQGRWHGLTLPLPEAGEYFVYVRIHDTQTRRMTWTAPIWVNRL